jgi:hyperosmotically inducible periplasmic protein
VNVPVPAVQAQDKSPDKHQSESQPSPDNTEKNLPTNHRNANRADQQSDEAGDRELTRKIRQSLVQDKSLSVYAHNVKIITRGGMVELKGPVRSQAEKDAINAKATEIAGGDKVKNDLTVKD